MCFASHFFDFVIHIVEALGLLGALFQWQSGFNWEDSIREAVSTLKAKSVRFQGDIINGGKAGSFIGFEDPDRNQLYLAELNWSHVEKRPG